MTVKELCEQLMTEFNHDLEVVVIDSEGEPVEPQITLLVQKATSNPPRVCLAEKVFPE